MNYELLSTVKLRHRQGYDVTVRFTDAQQGVDENKVFFWAGTKEPTLEKMTNRLAHLSQNILDSLNEEPDETMLQSEVVDLLIEKGYLKEGDKLEDLSEKGVEP